MVYTLKPPPVCAVFRHRTTTPPRRLAVLTERARKTPTGKPDGLSVPALAAAISATDAEARDAVQALGKSVVCYWPGKGWRVRLRSAGERRLVAANDNREASIWAA
jgi:hypothetical protein